VVLALVCVVLAAAAGLWVVSLDRQVVQEFQGRHWSVPARVYGAPLELYAGAPVAANDLEDELRRLHYRPGDPAQGTGIYRRRSDSFEVHARRVRFNDELREAQLITVKADADSIKGLEPAGWHRRTGVPARSAGDRQRLSRAWRGSHCARARRCAAAAALRYQTHRG
jgi:penicillin-binding protein 1B